VAMAIPKRDSKNPDIILSFPSMDILIRASKFLWVNLDLRGVLIKFIYEKLLSTVTKSGFLPTIIPISLGII
jgi:hypothetical protein